MDLLKLLAREEKDVVDVIFDTHEDVFNEDRTENFLEGVKSCTCIIKKEGCLCGVKC